MDIVQQMDELASILAEFVMKDRNHSHVTEFVKNCGDANIQKEWNSLTDEEQRAVSDELYYYLRYRT